MQTSIDKQKAFITFNGQVILKKDHPLWSKESSQMIYKTVKHYYYANYSKTNYLFDTAEEFCQSVIFNLFSQNGPYNYDPSQKSFKNYIWFICGRHAGSHHASYARRLKNQGIIKSLNEELDFSEISKALIDTIPDSESNNVELDIEFKRLYDSIPNEQSSVNSKLTLKDIFLEFCKNDNYDDLIYGMLSTVNYEQFELDIIDLLTARSSNDIITFNSYKASLLSTYPLNCDFDSLFNSLLSKILKGYDFNEHFQNFKNKVFVNKTILKKEINEIRDYLYFAN